MSQLVARLGRYLRRGSRPVGAVRFPRVGRSSVWAVLALLVAAGGVGAAPAAAETPVVPIVFPLEEKVEWTDTYGAPRGGGRSHAGNDIMVPKMTRVLAAADGTLDWMNLNGKTSSYNGLPYYNILLRGDDGNIYFYIHLNNDTPGTDDGQGGIENAYAPGLENGSRVEAGQFIGYAGDSGNAEDTGSHLHFEIHLGGYGNTINPYASLQAAPVAGGGSGGPEPPPSDPSDPDLDPGPGGQLDPGIPHFTDVGPSHWFFEDLILLYRMGAVKGGDDGTFHAYGELTRTHFAAFLVRTFAPEELAAEPPEERPFSDVPETFWGYEEIAAAARVGFVRGTGDGERFSPNDQVTRAQMATMLCRALGLEDRLFSEAGASGALLNGPGADPGLGSEPEPRVFADVPDGYWAEQHIALAQRMELVRGGADGRFRPEETTKRAHAVAVVARALRLQEGSD